MASPPRAAPRAQTEPPGPASRTELGRRARRPAGRRRVPAIEPRRALPLGLALVAGIGLRVWFELGYRPAFLGYSDSQAYIAAAHWKLFLSAVRPAGYPTFLRLVHGLSAHLSYTIVLQHALGLATGALLYGLLRRLDLSRTLAALAAGVLLLVGEQVSLEHAVMSDGPFAFLVMLALYGAVRAVDFRRPADAAGPSGAPGRRLGRRSLGWAAGTAVAMALSMTMRPTGLVLIPIIGLWLLAAGRASGGLRLAGLATGAALALVVAYVMAQWAVTGVLGITQSDGWVSYARVGPFANCARFTPPAGTQKLCETTPESRRGGGDFYEWDPQSPAVRLFGLAPHGNARLAAFSHAAMLHQPLDYLRFVARDVLRFVAPDTGLTASNRYTSGQAPALLIDYLQYAPNEALALGLMSAYYNTHGFRRAHAGALRDYAKAMRLGGARLGLVLVLALLAVLLGRGRRRRGALLLVAAGAGIMVLSAASLMYGARYGVPGYGPLLGAAALGVAALADAVRERPGPPARPSGA